MIKEYIFYDLYDIYKATPLTGSLMIDYEKRDIFGQVFQCSYKYINQEVFCFLTYFLCSPYVHYFASL